MHDAARLRNFMLQGLLQGLHLQALMAVLAVT